MKITLYNFAKCLQIASFLQSARCPVVSQPYLAALTPKSRAGVKDSKNYLKQYKGW